MAYNYKGTSITGTSSTAKTFPKSGVSNASVGNTYLNTEKGHVYKCTTAGKPSAAKWKYIKTEIIKKPKVGVKSLGSPKRITVNNNNHYMKAEWKVPKKLTDKKSGSRATGITVTWRLGIPGKDKKKVIESGNESLTSSQINLNNLKIGSTTYTRNSFYPGNSSRTLDSVTVIVRPFNESNGKKRKGKVRQTATRNFYAPVAPEIGEWNFDAETGVISNKIITDAGNGYQERYDTRYQMIIEDTNQDKTWNELDTHSTDTEINVSYNAANYQQLEYGDYIKVTIKAWARGYAGDSKVVTSTYYISFPAQTTIDSVKASSDKVGVSPNDPTGKCTVYLNTNNTEEHPVDRVKLEYLANSTYETEGSIPGDASWTDSNIVDDGECTAMAIAVTNLIPDPGKFTWLRVKSFHASESVLYRYSQAVRATDLETPAATATDESVKILDTTPGDDGKSIIVQLGWNENGADDSTGTELTWSDAEDAWRSTDDPEEYLFAWSDGPVTSGGVTYRDSATITIKGLHESTLYFIRARRYLEDETTTYSPYSNPASQLTSATPEAVVATCANYVAAGTSLPVYWTYSGTSMQTSWQIVSSSGTMIAQGDDSLGATQIAADRLATFAINNALTFTVQVSTGSDYVVSEEHTIRIVEPPTLTLTAEQTLTDQPYSFTVVSNSECNLTYIVTSQGSVSEYPEGIRRQTTGDTIYSAVIRPIWTASGSNYTTTVTLPGGLDFWDLVGYTLTVTATDLETGLKSDQKTATFSVNWSHKAPSPVQQSFSLTSDTTVNDETVYYEYSDGVYVSVEPDGSENPSSEGWYVMTEIAYVELTPIDTTDDNGVHVQAVQIDLTPPAGSVSTDVYDIYRVTGDGYYMIGEGFPLTHTTTDNYSPFGDALTQEYRFAIRTADGDVEFEDVEYVAAGSKMRFDWPGGVLELPYNIQIGDKYKKDVQIRKHMDGSNDAYWNSNIERTGSLNSDLIRLEQQDDVLKARALAHYPGAVFVRTPDGSAYEADVQISDMSTDGLLETIAIDATEIGLTDEYTLPTPFDLGD